MLVIIYEIVLQGKPIETYLRKKDNLNLSTRTTLKLDEKILWLFFFITYGTFTYIKICIGIELSLYKSSSDKDKINQSTILKQRAGLFVTSNTYQNDDIDYFNRIFQYTNPMTLSVSQYKALSFLNRLNLNIPDEKTLISWIISTAQTNTIIKLKDDWYIYADEPFEYGVWLQKRRYFKYPYIPPDIIKIKFNIKTFELILIDKNYNEYDKNYKYYKEALIHTIALIGITTTIGGEHSWIHIHLPCIISEGVKTILTKNSVLYNLLLPHIRFSSNIANQVLWTPLSTKYDLSNPVFSFPMDYNDSLLGGIYDGILEKYGKQYKDNDISFFERCNYINGDFDKDLPYHKFIMNYYYVIEYFIESIIDHIDKDEFLLFEKYIKSKFIGRWFDDNKDIKYRMIKLLSCFIHMVSIQHSADHYSFWVGISSFQSYLCLKDSIDTLDFNKSIKNQFEISRTQCANNTFSYTYQNKNIPMFFKINYNFNNDDLIKLNNKFKCELNKMEQQLINEEINYCPSDCIFSSISG